MLPAPPFSVADWGIAFSHTSSQQLPSYSYSIRGHNTNMVLSSLECTLPYPSCGAVSSLLFLIVRILSLYFILYLILIPIKAFRFLFVSPTNGPESCATTGLERLWNGRLIYRIFESQALITSMVADLISTISDPEHPLSLGELAVVNLPHIKVTDNQDHSAMSHVLVEITPTITHCSLATVIGLGIRVRLEQALPPRFRLDVRIREGTHSTADQVNKQLNDKERVAAACENESLMAVLRKMLETCKWEYRGYLIFGNFFAMWKCILVPVMCGDVLFVPNPT